MFEIAQISDWKILFVPVDTGYRVFKLEMLETLAFLLFSLLCIKVQLSALLELLKILNPDFPLSVRAL